MSLDSFNTGMSGTFQAITFAEPTSESKYLFLLFLKAEGGGGALSSRQEIAITVTLKFVDTHGTNLYRFLYPDFQFFRHKLASTVLEPLRLKTYCDSDMMHWAP